MLVFQRVVVAGLKFNINGCPHVARMAASGMSLAFTTWPWRHVKDAVPPRIFQHHLILESCDQTEKGHSRMILHDVSKEIPHEAHQLPTKPTNVSNTSRGLDLQFHLQACRSTPRGSRRESTVHFCEWWNPLTKEIDTSTATKVQLHKFRCYVDGLHRRLEMKTLNHYCSKWLDQSCVHLQLVALQ